VLELLPPPLRGLHVRVADDAELLDRDMYFRDVAGQVELL
jgi:hypothetical protein